MKKLKQINIWQWCARVIPVLYLVGSLAFYWIDEGTPYRLWAVLGLTLVSGFAIIWWWWAMDTMHWIMQMFKDNVDRYEKISEEIHDLRKDLPKNKK